MKKELEFPGCILVHTISGTTHLLDGPRDLMDLMDGDCLDDACMDEGRKTLPTDSGVYSATIEYWFQQGYFEGYPAPGESDYDFRLSNLRRIDLSRTPAPAEVEDNLVGAMWNKKDNTFVCQSCGTKHELGHFRVVKPDEEVEELEAGNYRMMIPVEITIKNGLLLDRKDGMHVYRPEDYPNARFFKGW